MAIIFPPAGIDVFPPTGKVNVLSTGYDATKFIPAGSEVATITKMDVAQDGLDLATLAPAIDVSRIRGTVADADLADITQTVTHVAGSNTLAQALQVQSTVGNHYNADGSYDDAPATNVWNLTARLYSSACRGSDAGPVDSQHVSFMSGVYRNVPPGGVPSGHVMAQLWAQNWEVYDYTNLESSIAGAFQGVEIDCAAGNRDDANVRASIELIYQPITALADGGYPNEWGNGIVLSGSETGGQFDGFVKWGVQAAVPYSISLLDARSSTPMDTTVKTTLGAPSTTIAVNNVWGFTSAGAQGLPVSVGNPGPVWINGTAYTQTGFTIDGPGVTSGTITLSSAVSVANGTAGNKVECNARAIWLPTGAKIALSTGGDSYIFVDSGGAFNFVGFAGTLLKLSAAGETLVASLNASGGIGLYGKTDPGQQTVTGSKGGNAALASVITALAKYGIVVDATT